MLSDIVEKCKAGTFATALQAVEGIATPAIREVKPVTAYSGTLDLGDYESDMETSMAIEVVRYPKTKTARAPSASKFVPVGGPQASSGKYKWKKQHRNANALLQETSALSNSSTRTKS